MKSALGGLARELSDLIVRPHVDRVKTKILMGLITAGVVGLFGFLGLVCLFLLVFFGMTQNHDPQTASLILFCACVFISGGAVIVHIIANRIEDRAFEDEMEGRSLFRLSSRAARSARDGDLQRSAQDYFAENKVAALAAALVIGAVVSARPGLVIKLGALALGSSRRSKRLR